MTTPLKVSSTSQHSFAHPPSPAHIRNHAAQDTEVASLHEVSNLVRELHTLLEDYAPTWYSQQHHHRTELALRQLDRLQRSGPILVR